ncbi:glycosyltransferase [Marinilabiliaceae bacterium ANBcel2]|nr:glycosyltransferase [Marinilabiliaceae bacterium ANBcel2]
MPEFSFIIPVYNRAEEVDELLQTIIEQTSKNFEVIIVEDGSEETCEHIIQKHENKATIKYIVQNNSGPGSARNNGAKKARGCWLIFLDSDCLLPRNYLDIVKAEVDCEEFDGFGGPDKAHPAFNRIQQAIGYAMSSVITTGGIRGAKEQFDLFYPRSYNMGVRNSVFNALEGFSDMRFGEDLDFSMRLIKKGYSTRLIKEGFVFHKRRNNFRSFFKQVYNSGIARINLEMRHKGTTKLVHWLPSLFILSHILIFLIAFAYPWILLLLIITPAIIYVHANKTLKNKTSALWAVAAAYVQTVGYGLGFLEGIIVRRLLKKREFHAFKENFYK